MIPKIQVHKNGKCVCIVISSKFTHYTFKEKVEDHEGMRVSRARREV